jgi:hypothetical protein
MRDGAVRAGGYRSDGVTVRVSLPPCRWAFRRRRPFADGLRRDGRYRVARDDAGFARRTHPGV